MSIEILGDSHQSETTRLQLGEYFTPQTLHIPEGDIPLTKESIVPTFEGLLAQNQRVLLLGEPGSGKSTLLREMLHAYHTTVSNSYDTVVYLPLRAFEENNESFIDFFQQKKTTQHGSEPEHVLWILDGMDEVKDPAHMASLMEEITISRPEDHVMVAARPIVSEEGFFREYIPVTIRPFDIEQILSFAQLYSRRVYGDNYIVPLPGTTKDGRPLTVPLFVETVAKDAFDNNKSIKYLLSSPISLPYIIDILADGYLFLPYRRSELFRDIIDNCDEHRWAKKDPQSFVSVFGDPDRESYRDLYESDKEFLESESQELSVRLRMIRFYKYIAIHMMTDFGQSVVTRDQMKEVLAGYFSELFPQDVMAEESASSDFSLDRAEKFLQAADSGLPLIIKLEENGYGFAHRSLFEFLIAQDLLTRSGDPEEAVSFCKEHDLLFSLHWRETMRMFMELQNQAMYDKELKEFFHLILLNSSEAPYESVLAAASFVTHDICIGSFSPLIKEIYTALADAISDLKDNSDTESQIILYRLRKQEQRLFIMIADKGLQKDIFRR
ncbi:MAG TPA: NACHT domain-containing protein [Patescibacteria group bacterium]|nr:NACHT domain-containing protein [Patescibacteria group bacterium]